MDGIRLRKLAGMDTAVTEELLKSVKDLEITEEIHMGKHINLDTNEETMASLRKRMLACVRAMDIIPKLKDPAAREKHAKRIAANARLIGDTLEGLKGEEAS